MEGITIARKENEKIPKCSKHSNYKAIKKPGTGCPECWIVWLYKRLQAVDHIASVGFYHANWPHG